MGLDNYNTEEPDDDNPEPEGITVKANVPVAIYHHFEEVEVHVNEFGEITNCDEVWAEVKSKNKHFNREHDFEIWADYIKDSIEEHISEQIPREYKGLYE